VTEPPAGSGSVRRMRLRQQVYLSSRPNGELALLHSSHRGERIGRLTEGQLVALRQLSTGWHTERELCATMSRHDGRADRTLLRRLIIGGWLGVQFEYGQRMLFTIRPLGPNPEPPPVHPAAPRLSRFALLRRQSGALVLESPLARATIAIHDHDVLTLVHQLAGPGPDPNSVSLPEAVVDELIMALSWHRFVHEAEEDSRPDLAGEQWMPHELLFHSRSRAGYHDEPFGGTLWAAGRFEPLPARHEPFGGTAIPLPRPGATTYPPLTDVLDSRRSIRGQDAEHPLTIDQLGEFLHRGARVLAVNVDEFQEVSLRPTPSGGALHALEIYPVVTSVAGLAPGMYHYDPFDHLLEPLPPRNFPIGQLVAKAAAAAGGSTPPQVLLVISCRFGRVMWKYQSMAYALVLKEVGALFQTFYLVATAIGLAPCALGSGDAELFARATGLDPLVESSVGEFMLGSRLTSG
jgi:SagB-type dehydrogenase family enzyme